MDSGKTWTSSAFSVPSGCGTAVVPMKAPGSMADTSVGTTSVTRRSLASFRFSFSPVRVVMRMVSWLTESICPRRRRDADGWDRPVRVAARLAAASSVRRVRRMERPVSLGWFVPRLGRT
jgi:hypothetical protein